jgi:hypothetical protein
MARIDVLFSAMQTTQYILDFSQFKFWIDFRDANVDCSLMAPDPLTSSNDSQPRGRFINPKRLSELMVWLNESFY